MLIIVNGFRYSWDAAESLIGLYRATTSRGAAGKTPLRVQLTFIATINFRRRGERKAPDNSYETVEVD